MSVSDRISETFRRLGSIGSIHLVREEDVARVEHHGGSVRELNERQRAWMEEMQSVVDRWEQTL